MRKVVPSDAVCHLWAHKAQDEARTPSSNCYFTGPTLYSYGSHFVVAHHAENGRVLWNDDTRSNTTSGHQTDARRAMTQQQWRDALHFPSLSSDNVREVDNAIKTKTLPAKTAKALHDEIVTQVKKTANMKHGSGPFEHCLSTALRYEVTLRYVYSLTRKKYPLPAVPDAPPVDKAERAVWILTFAKKQIVEDFESALSAAGRDYQYQPYGDDAYKLQSQINMLESSAGYLNQADRLYAMLHPGKVSAKVKALRKVIAPKLGQARADLAEHQRVGAIKAIDHTVAQYFLRLRTPGHHTYTHNIHSTLTTAKKLLPETDMRITALQRAVRKANAAATLRSAETLRTEFASAFNADSAQRFSDAKRQYQSVIARAEVLTSPLGIHLLKPLQANIDHARTRLAQIDADIAAKHATVIADWIAGTSSTKPPYEAGTFARINGSNIETTHGASVPIEHACRLARVFDRVVSAGGKAWDDGSGPMVGHYRVNSIGADGTLVIGCHHFNPTEATRLRDLLKACAECAKETADAE